MKHKVLTAVVLFFHCLLLCTKDTELLRFLDKYYSTEHRWGNFWQKPVQMPLAYKPVHNKKKKLKDWNFLMYIAADNNLSFFAGRNVNQAKLIGSTDYINVLIDLHVNIKGKKVSKRLYAKKDKLVQIGPDQVRDSGAPETVVDFFKWAHDNYPAKHVAFDFWSHGSGSLEPHTKRAINPMEFFYFDPVAKIVRLDRSLAFLDFVNAKSEKKRGICFDETTRNYLTNQQLAQVLDAMCTIQKKEIDIVYFDACFMAMSEIAILLKGLTKYIVGSQEVELATGGRYDLILEPFVNHTLTPEEFAKHLVTAYEKTYNTITYDYTQSAIDMKYIDELNTNIHTLATLLIEGMGKEKDKSVRKAIKASRNSKICPSFAEPSYTDYYSFCKNLLDRCDQCQLQNDELTQIFRDNLKQELNRSGELINKLIIANYVGKNLITAKGISIYFPEYGMNAAYQQTRFAAANSWPHFLAKYLTKENYL